MKKILSALTFLLILLSGCKQGMEPETTVEYDINIVKPSSLAELIKISPLVWGKDVTIGYYTNLDKTPMTVTGSDGVFPIAISSYVSRVYFNYPVEGAADPGLEQTSAPDVLDYVLPFSGRGTAGPTRTMRITPSSEYCVVGFRISGLESKEEMVSKVIADLDGTQYSITSRTPFKASEKHVLYLVVKSGKYASVTYSLVTDKDTYVTDPKPANFDAGTSIYVEESLTTATGPQGVKVGESISAAIEVAASGSVVLVQSGIFELESSLVLKEGVSMSGGWDETFTTQDGKTTLLGKGTDRIILQTMDFETETKISNFVIKGGRTGDNSASTNLYGGGGIFMRGGLVVEDCEITDCQATDAKGWGGGILMQGGTVRNCSIHGNSAGYVSAAIVTNANTKDTMGNCIIEDCDIYDNTCPQFVIQLYTAEMRRCKVHDNTATKNIIRLQTQGSMYDCLFCDNISTTVVDGADALVNNANNKVVNCTFIGANSPAGSGCAAVSIAQNATFVNNVVYAPALNTDIKVASGKTPVFSNCFYKNGSNDTGAVDCNKEFDPESIFVSLSGRDFHPSATSALKNAGKDISGTSKSTLDLDRNARVCGTSVDVGCYEYQE